MAAYPATYSVPGVTWPGAAIPGLVPQITLTWYQFTGPQTLIYPDYIDMNAGHTLVAVPGGEYELQPPPGTTPPAVPGDGYWTAITWG